jgi:hypothetical protein
MPLPTTNLTAHFDASDADHLFKTWVDGGAHTGTPVDGEEVQVWKAEAGGSVQPLNAAYPSVGRAPVYRSSSSPMLLPCLDFDGSEDELRLVTDATNNSYYGTGSFFGSQAKTLIVAFYARSITGTSIGDHGIAGGSDGAFVLGCRDVGGTKKTYASNGDGNIDSVDATTVVDTTYVACLRHDATNLYLSIDGGAEVQVATGATSPFPESHFSFGRYFGSAVRFHGCISEAALYNAALTGTDLTDAIAYFRAKHQGVTSGVYRPNSDQTTTGWTSTAGTFFSVLDETTPSDADYVTSPTITGTGSKLIVGLSNGPLAAGKWTTPVRANTSAGTATLRVSLLNDSNDSQGSVDITGVTTTITRYDPQITTTGSATRLALEFITS